MPLWVDRERALFGSWYEFFPRSEGAVTDPTTGVTKSGTFRTAMERLPAVAAMGFDVVYLPPIHPIGTTNRKGPNNTLTPGPDDPGSPWAIGGEEGGHDAIHPDLGTIEDFDAFVARARELGLEVALDLALQATPDHPWVKEHPEWFTVLADGTIAYAENPPKKYQDIYPLNFDNDPEGIYAEVLRVLRHWMDHGVRIFRVDNPHTKPVAFWDWLLAEVRQTDPDVLFLAEAFTQPAMMQTLARIGFHQSYTYFTWRNEKWELEEYLTELSQQTGHFLRPNFFVNTPDILHAYLQYGGPPAFKIRAVLAATLSPSWGVYSGYELFEHVAVRPGSEEYLDSEKYQLRPRDWAGGRGRGPHPRAVPHRAQRIRREHPALQRLRNLRFHAHRQRPGHLLLQARGGTARSATSCSWWSTSTRTASARRRSTSTCRRSASTGTTASRSTTSSPARPTCGASTTTCASTRSSSRPTCSPSAGCRRDATADVDRQLRRGPGRGARSRTGTSARSSTRCWSAPSRTPTATAPATSAASPRSSTTCSGSASTASGCRRSSSRRCATAATTSATTSTCCRSSAPSGTSCSSSTRRTTAACG